jgi:predicted nucleic acid-binding protein
MRAYLDACIVLDYLLERNEASIDFIENFARKNGIKLVLSNLTLIETLAGMKDRFMLLKLIFEEGLTPEEVLRMRRERDPTKEELAGLLNQLKKFVEFDVKDIAEILDEPKKDWQTILESLETLKNTALDATDALHVHNALKAGCDVFLTRDGSTTRRVKQHGLIAVKTPEEFMKEVKHQNSN